MERGVGHVVGRVAMAVLGDRRLPRPDRGDEVAGEVDGVRRSRRQRRVPLAPGADGAGGRLALVPDGDRHRGRLADDAEARPHAEPVHRLDHPAHPDAADLLVIGEREVERCPERARSRGGRGVERAGEEPLHVGRPAPVEPAVRRAEDERVRAPRLPLDRHHIGVPREQHAGAVRRPDGRKQPGLPAGVVSHQHAFHAVPGEEAPDPFDKLEVRRGADRLEPDQPGEDIRRGRHGGGS